MHTGSGPRRDGSTGGTHDGYRRMTGSDECEVHDRTRSAGTAFGVRVDSREVPLPGPGHVLVAVEAVALSAADTGETEPGVAPASSAPLYLGWSGRVEATGAGVDPLLRGRRSVVRSDPDRPSLAVLDAGTGPAGYGRRPGPGPWVLRRRLAVPLDRLHLLPDDADTAVAALLEPTAAAAAAFEAALPAPRESVVVLGAGPVGLLLVQVLAATGPQDLVVVDPDPDRGALAVSLGATRHCASVGAARVAGVFGVVVETTGTAAAPGAACLLAAQDGTVVFTRAFPGGTKPLDRVQLALRRLTLRVAAVHAPETWDAAVRYLRAGVIDPRPLITRRTSFASSADGVIEPHPDGRGAVTVLLL